MEISCRKYIYIQIKIYKIRNRHFSKHVATTNSFNIIISPNYELPIQDTIPAIRSS